MRCQIFSKDEYGAALVEFAVAAVVFVSAMFAVIEGGRLLWTHNALADATRRGARYAINHGMTETDKEAVRNIVRYGKTERGSAPIISGLDTTPIEVNYSEEFGLANGTVTVSIPDYEFRFIVPFFGTMMPMPDYRTTLTAENVGLVPPNIGMPPVPTPTPAPTPTPGPTPTTTPTPAPTATPTPTPTPAPTPCPNKKCR